MLNIRRHMPASGIRQIFDLAAKLEQEGNKILRLDVGRPDWPLPPGVADEATAALNAGHNHYIANRGLIELREGIARDIERRSGAKYDPANEMIVTLGASEAVCMAMLAFIGAGDEVIVPIPTWPHYEAIIEMVGGTPVLAATDPADGFRIDPDRICSLITPRTRMLIVNSPGNPTGTVQEPERLEALARLAEELDLYLLSDEVYQDFVFDGVHHSMAGMIENRERLILTNSFSKSFAMTGWRIGWVASGPRTSDAMLRIHQYLTVCGVAFAQKGAANMLAHPSLPDFQREMQAAFQERYRVWKTAFEKMDGVTFSPPGGAFYVFPEFRLKRGTARDLCDEALRKIHVAMVPGDVFGSPYANCVRISYGRELETQREAAARLAEFWRESDLAG